MRILFIGDIVGRPGRRSLRALLPQIRAEFLVDIVVANGENAAGGLGATPETLDEILNSGVDAVTLGNHTWRKKSLVSAIDHYDSVVRPANYPEGVPGVGARVIGLSDGRQLGLVNVLGRVFMEPFACPFETSRREVDRLRETTPVVLVDFHAEATSEKAALAWFLDGRCSAVVGTHTHVQTADERVLPGGTAYITDVGMTGPRDSAIGVEVDRVIQKFTTGIPAPFTVAKGDVCLCGVCIAVDDETGRATGIERIMRISQ